MGLQTLWLMLITVLWAGFFVLEGFDFGVGMLVPFLAHDDTDTRVLRATTGPFWDGNEVWLITVGGATFAAFPDWYATMFSAYYLPLFAVLAALILRATGLEYRDKAKTAAVRQVWDWAIAVSCLLVPLLVGVVFGGLLGGLPIDAQHEFTGTFADLIQPYALFSGLTFAALCLMQGLAFVRVKATDDLDLRAERVLKVLSIVMFVVLFVYAEWTQGKSDGGVVPGAGACIALTFAGAAAWLAQLPAHRLWAFVCTSGAIAFTVLGFFGELNPNLMVSTTNAAYNLTTADSSSSYTLTLITIITVVMLPVVLLYTCWSYWVFRQRITRADVATAQPVATSGNE